MKKGLFLFMSFFASASFATVISKKTVVLPVNLSPTGIVLSSFGYSRPLVKVLIPELAAATIMNHRNPGSNAPCLSTTETENIEDVVQGQPTTEQIPFTVTLEKHVSLVDESEPLRINARPQRSPHKVCSVELVETVEGTIRGFHFTHERSVNLPTRVKEDCQ